MNPPTNEYVNEINTLMRKVGTGNVGFRLALRRAINHYRRGEPSAGMEHLFAEAKPKCPEKWEGKFEVMVKNLVFFDETGQWLAYGRELDKYKRYCDLHNLDCDKELVGVLLA